MTSSRRYGNIEHHEHMRGKRPWIVFNLTAMQVNFRYI